MYKNKLPLLYIISYAIKAKHKSRITADKVKCMETTCKVHKERMQEELRKYLH